LWHVALNAACGSAAVVIGAHVDNNPLYLRDIRSGAIGGALKAAICEAFQICVLMPLVLFGKPRSPDIFPHSFVAFVLALGGHATILRMFLSTVASTAIVSC